MKKFCLRLTTFAALSGALVAGPVAAQSMPGKELAAQCAQCHGTNGSGGFLQLAGRNSGSLYKQLLTMKARSTPQSIMDWQARGYTDAQLWQIAEYFAAQSRNGDTSTGTSPDPTCNPNSPKCQ
jgi:sulfide dehydrogenase cytochrome subunit